MQAIARPRLLASVQQVLLPSCTPKIRPAVVQSVVVEMIDIANVSGWQVEHDPVHSYRYVLALYQSIPHGVHVVVATVRLCLPSPLVQEVV